MRYRSISVFCLGGWSPLLPTGFLVSRGTPDTVSHFHFFTWLSHSLVLFPNRFFSISIRLYSPYPKWISSPGLASFDFARHYFRNLGWLLFLALLRCFSSGGSPHIPMYSVYDDKTFLLPDCSIRKSADQSPLTAPRSLSQLVTSFFGSRCQGIPLVLFVAWPLWDIFGSSFLVMLITLFAV